MSNKFFNVASVLSLFSMLSICASMGIAAGTTPPSSPSPSPKFERSGAGDGESAATELRRAIHSYDLEPDELERVFSLLASRTISSRELGEALTDAIRVSFHSELAVKIIRGVFFAQDRQARRADGFAELVRSHVEALRMLGSNIMTPTQNPIVDVLLFNTHFTSDSIDQIIDVTHLRNNYMIRRLIEHPKISANTLVNVIRRAVRFGFAEIAKLAIAQLRESGLRISDEFFVRLLTAAVEDGRTDVVRLLLEENRFGLRETQTAYDEAIAHGHLETAQVLREVEGTAILRIGGVPAAIAVIGVAWWMIRSASGV